MLKEKLINLPNLLGYKKFSYFLWCVARFEHELKEFSLMLSYTCRLNSNSWLLVKEIVASTTKNW